MSDDVRVRVAVGSWQLDELREQGVDVYTIDDRHVLIDGELCARVMTPAEAEAVPFVTCPSVSTCADDIHTRCTSCAWPIVYRPTAPTTPPKLCAPCTRVWLSGHATH